MKTEKQQTGKQDLYLVKVLIILFFAFIIIFSIVYSKSTSEDDECSEKDIDNGLCECVNQERNCQFSIIDFGTGKTQYLGCEEFECLEYSKKNSCQLFIENQESNIKDFDESCICEEEKPILKPIFKERDKQIYYCNNVKDCFDTIPYELEKINISEPVCMFDLRYFSKINVETKPIWFSHENYSLKNFYYDKYYEEFAKDFDEKADYTKIQYNYTEGNLIVVTKKQECSDYINEEYKDNQCIKARPKTLQDYSCQELFDIYPSCNPFSNKDCSKEDINHLLIKKGCGNNE